MGQISFRLPGSVVNNPAYFTASHPFKITGGKTCQMMQRNRFQISGRSERRYMGAHQGREIDQHAEQGIRHRQPAQAYKAVPVKAARPANNRLPDYIPHAQIGKKPQHSAYSRQYTAQSRQPAVTAGKCHQRDFTCSRQLRHYFPAAILSIHFLILLYFISCGPLTAVERLVLTNQRI